jgi:hypothetical protein
MLFLIPFFHTGFKANYLIGKFNLMAELVNPTDFKSAFQDSPVTDSNGYTASYKNKFFIWQIGYSGDKLSAYLNGQQGSNNPWSKTYLSLI